MISIPTTVHGRVLVEPGTAGASASRVLVGFHGYAQTAGDMMAELRQIPGADEWLKVSIQALNRFYLRGDQKVVASWMTREDREQVIADNIAYVNAALDTVLAPISGRPVLVFLGFSQGVAMAYRAALCGTRTPSGIIALAGDVPPDVQVEDGIGQPWPPVLVGVGDKEEWYSPEKVSRDRQFLTTRGVRHSLVTFKGGHEFTDDFRAAAGRFLLEVGNPTRVVFFYGLFMDTSLLESKGACPSGATVGWVNDRTLRIGRRATLVPENGGRVYGVMMTLGAKQLQALYADDSLADYIPESVMVSLPDGASRAALCYCLPVGPPEGTNREYARALLALATQLGLPDEYLRHIGSFVS